jgi:glycosyltransferase involved in cell wall biosynthesis
MSRATRTIVVSRPNLRLARRLHTRAHIELIENPVRTDYFRRVFPRSDHPVVVMTASYHYPPNHEAAVHLVRAIFPQVRARVADVELRLVGQRMPEDLAALASATPGVTVVGKVDDVRPELDRAWVAVAPMTKGSGSPLKVLEALSMGVPVVTTSRVATSLELAEREGLVTADTPGAFAETVAELLTREERRDLLGAAGARAVPERFGHERLAAKLERVWTEAMTERSPG